MLEDRHVKRRKGVDEGDAEMNVDEGEADWVDPVSPLNRSHEGADASQVDTAIGNLREYLRNRLRQNKLVTDWKDSARVAAANQKVKPEPVPEHNDHYRIDWADVEGRKYVIGDEVSDPSIRTSRLTELQALRIPESSNFKVRYPILHRGLNLREWRSSQLLMDDIAIILEETLRNELSIYPRDYSVSKIGLKGEAWLTIASEILRHPHSAGSWRPNLRGGNDQSHTQGHGLQGDRSATGQHLMGLLHLC